MQDFRCSPMITTTGFVVVDYTQWSSFLTLLFFLLLFLGACAGSTSGGIKIIRHLVFLKNTLLEFKRLMHPSALIRTKIDKRLVPAKVMTHILVFLMIYLFTFMIGSLVMAYIFNDWDTPLLTAVGAVATSLGNVGPAIAELGPTDNFSAVPVTGKWFLFILNVAWSIGAVYDSDFIYTVFLEDELTRLLRLRSNTVGRSYSYLHAILTNMEFNSLPSSFLSFTLLVKINPTILG